MFSKKIINILLVASLAVLLFGSGYKLGEYKTQTSKVERPTYNLLNTKPEGKAQAVNFDLFWDVWNKIEEKYVDKTKVDPKKMFYGAIKGMVASLEDPYTFFLTPEENEQSKNDLGGKFEGIGAQLGLKENRIVIVAPLKDSPAEKAGVRAGDVVDQVDGVSTKGWTLPQAVSKIRGPKGSKVKLTLLRGGKPLTIEIERDAIHISSVEYKKEASVTCKTCRRVGYLKLNQFGDNTNSEWDKAVVEIDRSYRAGEIEGLVLDLRDNPGGYLESAVYLASEFLPRGRLVVKQESTSADSEEYVVEREGKLPTIPLVVLINKGSASASEILAGALRDYNRATLVGEKSFGKGSVQEALDLADQAGLHVTVAKWILPKGDWINSKGIEPAVAVELTLKEGDTLTRETDAQLEKAVLEIVQ